MQYIHVFYGKIENIISGLDTVGERGKKESLAGRRLLRQGLFSQYRISLPEGLVGLAELEHMLKKSENGKPFLRGYPEIRFNITHSGEYAACALAEIEVGLDIQVRQPIRNARLLERTMSPAQQEAVRSAADPELKFAQFWAQKESYLKWTGEGITVDLSGLSMEGACMEALKIQENYAGCVCAGEPFSVLGTLCP